jgi:ubiquitin-activating enzyme E1
MDNLRFSRTLISYEESAFSKLFNSKLLLIGLDPLGTEICKIMLLFGVQSLTIFDDSILTGPIYKSNFFVNITQLAKKKLIQFFQIFMDFPQMLEFNYSRL